MIPEHVGRYLRTVQHLTPSQIGHRTRLLALRASYRRLPRLTRARFKWMAEEHTASWADWSLFPACPRLTRPQWRMRSMEARSVAAGQFRFVNRTVELGQHPAWRDHGQSQLWSYHLHYFDYLLSLGLWWRVEQAPEALESATRLIVDWIESNPPAGRRLASIHRGGQAEQLASGR